MLMGLLKINTRNVCGKVVWGCFGDSNGVVNIVNEVIIQPK